MSAELNINAPEEKRLQEELQRRLLEVGLLTEITPPMSPDQWPKNRQPVPIEGEPISEMIIRERR